MHQGINLCMLSIYRVFVAFPVLNSYVVYLNVLSLKASFFSVSQREKYKIELKNLKLPWKRRVLNDTLIAFHNVSFELPGSCEVLYNNQDSVKQKSEWFEQVDAISMVRSTGGGCVSLFVLGISEWGLVG